MNCNRFLSLLFVLSFISALSSNGPKPSTARHKRLPKRSHSRDLAEARKYLSLPDLTVLGEGGNVPTHKAINTWASSIRKARQATSSPNNNLESPVKSPNQDVDLLEPRQHEKDICKTPERANPWQRLMALPLWQTSLLSLKHVLVHSNDEVTYRERTFPTARYSAQIFTDIEVVSEHLVTHSGEAARQDKIYSLIKLTTLLMKED